MLSWMFPLFLRKKRYCEEWFLERFCECSLIWICSNNSYTLWYWYELPEVIFLNTVKDMFLWFIWFTNNVMPCGQFRHFHTHTTNKKSGNHLKLRWWVTTWCGLIGELIVCHYILPFETHKITACVAAYGHVFVQTSYMKKCLLTLDKCN